MLPVNYLKIPVGLGMTCICWDLCQCCIESVMVFGVVWCCKAFFFFNSVVK